MQHQPTFVRDRYLCTLVFAALLVAFPRSSPAQSAPAAAPVLACNNGELVCVDPPSGGGDAPYDLYYTDSRRRGDIPFSFSWPTRPQGIQRNLTVTDAPSLAQALATPNARITVAAGAYGALAISQNDQHWILNDDATFSDLSASGRPARIHIEGGNFEVANGAGDNITLVVDDWLIQNACIAVNSLQVGIGSQQSNRYALINSTVVAQRYAHFTPGQTAVPNKGSSHILAGNNLQGGMLVGNSGIESTVRTQGINEVILVDNWLRNGFDGQGVKHTLRSHYGQNNWWARNNLIVYGDGAYWNSTGGTGPEQVMGRHYFYDNVQYVPSSNPNDNTAHFFRTSSSMATFWPNRSGAIVVEGNRTFDHRATAASSARYIVGSQAWDHVEDNVNDTYRSPPELGAWLVGRGIPPGCDH